MRQVNPLLSVTAGASNIADNGLPQNNRMGCIMRTVYCELTTYMMVLQQLVMHVAFCRPTCCCNSPA